VNAPRQLMSDTYARFGGTQGSATRARDTTVKEFVTARATYLDAKTFFWRKLKALFTFMALETLF